MLHCSDCGFENVDGFRFCTNCRAALALACPKCGFRNPPGSLYCGQCAADLLDAGSPRPVHAKRHLTLLFCDLERSTALQAKLDLEDYGALIESFRNVCGTVLNRHGSESAQLLGDGVLAYFGHPVAHEDDAQRSVLAGLEIVDAVRQLNADLRLEREIELTARIGIHTGIVLVGTPGRGRDPILADGLPTSIAARIQTAAQPNTVLISHSTYRLVRGYFEFRERGIHAMKGVPPMPLYEAVRATGARSRVEAGASAGLTPFVGRQPEIDALSALWAEARHGRGHRVLLGGEPGIGKSRLLEVIKQRVDSEVSSILVCYCSHEHRTSALYPIIDLIQRQLEIGPEHPAEQRLAKLVSALGDHRFPLEESVPVLASLLSIPLDRRFPPLDYPAPRQRQLLMETLLRWLSAISEVRPVLFIVEDVHWMDPSTEEFLSYLLPGETEARILTLLTYRTDEEFRPPWSPGPRVHALTLEGLDRGETEQLIDELAGKRGLPSEVRRQVAEATEGVPLFTEEVTKAVLEGTIEKLPSSLMGLLQDRLTRLGSALDVAQLAATLGRQFSHEMLRAVSPWSDDRLRADLGRLVVAKLLLREGTPPDATYTFRHALVQTAADELLMVRATRREYHRLIAQGVVERLPTIRRLQPEMVAEHYSGAGMVACAIAYWRRAGRRALDRSANREAIEHLRRGLALLGQLPTTPSNLRRELAMQTALGPALMAIDGFSAPQVKETYDRALELCERMGRPLQLLPVLWGLWANAFVAGELQACLDIAERVLRIAQSVGEPMFLVAAHHAAGFARSFRGEHRLAVRHATDGLALFDLERERAIVRLFQFSSSVALHQFRATSLLLLGQPDRAAADQERVLALARELDHPPTLAFALSSETWFHHLRRDPARVVASADEALRISEQEVFSLWPPPLRFFRTAAHAQLEPRAAKALADMIAKEGAVPATTGNLRSLRRVLLAGSLAAAGWHERALAVVREGLVDAEARAEGLVVPELLRVRGEIRLAIGKRAADDDGARCTREEARADFEAALALAERQEAKLLALRARTSLARLSHAEGRADDSLAALEATLASFDEGAGSVDLTEARMLADTLHAARAAHAK